MNGLLTVLSLWRREVVRFYRQPSRIVGAVGSPLLFWLVLGSGIGRSFKSQASAAGMTYFEYFFPGTVLLVLMFTAIFSTISLIEDRREGFFQAVLVAPVSRWSIVLGKVMGGTTLACFQAALFLLLAPLAGVSLTVGGWLQVFWFLFIGGFVLTSLGFLLAWQFNSIQGFHAVMNLFLMPLWMLSGALFPMEGASGWIQILMRWNPLSYELLGLRKALYPSLEHLTSEHLAAATIITVPCGIILFLIACAMASRRRVGDVV